MESNQRISIDETLRIERFVLDPTSTSDFNLREIITYTGGATAGHYISEPRHLACET
jgi:hypothetical protein